MWDPRLEKRGFSVSCKEVGLRGQVRNLGIILRGMGKKYRVLSRRLSWFELVIAKLPLTAMKRISCSRASVELR